MSCFRRISLGTLGARASAWALVVAAALVLPGCKPAKTDDPAGRPVFELALGGSVGLSVDYQTRKIAAAVAAAEARVVLGFTLKDAGGVLTIDCSRLGGGLVTGNFKAYLGGAEVERGEFQCLYLRSREVVLAKKADTIKISDLKFIVTIE